MKVGYDRECLWLLQYKRGGQRVLINPVGDMIVRPSIVEISLQLTPAGNKQLKVNLAVQKGYLAT